MATLSSQPSLSPPTLQSDRFEQFLAFGAIILLGVALIAIGKGNADWPQIPASVWAHLATIGIALGLTPVMLLRKRGDRLHRRLGWAWVSAMFLTALLSFDIRLVNKGGLSIIHILSVWTTIQVPIIVWSAKTHNIPRHRRSVRGMVLGALLIAGFFTFPFDRLMGHWLFG
jgi:uncharacterized membrane protein